MQYDMRHSVENVKALAVERFDRAWAQAPEGDSRLIRLPQEDMCQARGVAPTLKYESDGGPGIDSIMDVLAGSSHREEDRRCFFKAQLLFWRMRTGRCARSFAATGSRWASAMA